MSFSGMVAINNQVCNRTGARWHLLWCWERCFKEEHRAFCKDLAASLALAGGHLACFRKAHLLARWAAQEPYVLLSDWREVKPCLSVIARHGCLDAPRMVVVVPDAAQACERAVAWARGCGARGVGGPVWVVGQLSGVTGLVREMAQHCGAVAAEVARSCGQSVNEPDAGLEDLGTGACSGQASTAPAEASMLGGGGGGPPGTVSCRPAEGSAGSGQRAPAAASFVAGRARLLHPAVTQLLARLFPSESTSEVHHLLLAQVPALYED